MIESMSREKSKKARAVERRVDPRGGAARLFESHGAEIFGFLLKILERRALAEDALQETFLRVLKHPEDALGRLNNARAWLFTIARRVAVDLIRKERRRREALDSTGSSAVLAALIAPDLAWRRLAEEERQRLVDQALARLEGEQRALLILLARGLSYREIGRVLDCAHATARRRATQALTALTRALGSYKIFDEEDL